MRTAINTILASVIIVTVFAGCTKKEYGEKTESAAAGTLTDIVKLLPQSIKEINLRTETVMPRTFTKELAVPAKILANQDHEALVGSLVQGRVCRVFAKAGDYVKAGQDLMLVEGLEIGEIKAQFLTASANVDYHKANFERQKKLLEENIGSQKTYLEAQNELEKSIAEYSAQVNRIKTIHLSENEIISQKSQSSDNRDFGTLSIKSPISGVVVERNVVIGQSIDVSANAFKIVNLVNVWADGQIYEKDIDKVKENTKVVFISQEFPDDSFTGRISYIGPIIDEKTRTITIRAEFSNESGKLKPQMFGELKIPVSKTDAFVVPAGALVKMDNADFVFVLKDNETFKRTPIIIGQSQNEFAEIRSGLENGDVVVVNGSSYLKAEMLKATLGEGE